MAYLLEVQAPGAPAEEHDLKLGRITLGFGEGAELPVKAPSWQPRHLALEVQPAGVRVQTLEGAAPGIVFDGAQVREALVPWGGEIFEGGVRLSFIASAQSSRKVHPLLLLSLGAAAIALAWQGGGAVGDADPTSTTVDPPQLHWGPQACPDTDPARALESARKQMHAAHAKQERYPFDASEGLTSLQQLRLAQACFAVAGAGNEAARADQDAIRLEQTLADDFAAGRLRLDRALEQRHFAEASAAVDALDTLLSPLGGGAYRNWLGELRSRIRRQQAE